jgi:metallo-beta-lactamase family protein
MMELLYSCSFHMAVSVSFFGAAQRVTGSSHTITLESGRKVFLDFGMFQGDRKTSAELNQEFPFDAGEYDAVIISHAHIDHTGRLPFLVKKGFKGAIYSTVATAELSNYMLLDSAGIQKADFDYATKQGLNPPEPIYNEDDVRATMMLFKTKPYHEIFKVNDELSCEFIEAGHVLGSAVVVLTMKAGDSEKKLVFTGDLGRIDTPILRDPDMVKQADYLICESTYGDRVHEGAATVDKDVAKVIRETAARGGRIIIPAFALERTQEIVYRLQRLFNHKLIPEMPVWVDSPMASEVTEIFRKHPELYDVELRKEVEEHQFNPFSVGRVKYTGSVQESKSLNDIRGPMIIISASGMCEAGRIKHHLAHGLGDRRNSVLIVGYQAVETMGRKLLEGEKQVEMWGKPFDVEAQIHQFHGFSAHAGKEELDSFVKNISGLKQIFLVHGELDQQEAFKKRIEGFCDAEVLIPSKEESIELK